MSQQMSFSLIDFCPSLSSLSFSLSPTERSPRTVLALFLFPSTEKKSNPIIILCPSWPAVTRLHEWTVWFFLSLFSQHSFCYISLSLSFAHPSSLLDQKNNSVFTREPTLFKWVGRENRGENSTNRIRTEREREEERNQTLDLNTRSLSLSLTQIHFLSVGYHHLFQRK